MIKNGQKMSRFARELELSLNQALSFVRGEGPARITKIKTAAPPPPMRASEIAALRRRFGMSEDQFALYLNVSAKTIRKWERGNQRPGGAALRLLQIVGQ